MEHIEKKASGLKYKSPILTFFLFTKYINKKEGQLKPTYT